MTTRLLDAWATAADVPAKYDGLFDAGVLTSGLLAASEVLWALSGYRWPGTEQVTVRPIPRCRCGRRNPPGSISQAEQVDLGYYPVVTIDQVQVDGAVVNAAGYRLDAGRWLVWEDETTSVPWPCCPRLDRALGETDTFGVQLTYGADPPEAGVRAAVVLGVELAKAWTADLTGECRLPARVQQQSRQGNTLQVPGVDTWRDGWTGLPECDLWLGSLRHGDAHRPAVVIDPLDYPAGRRTTETL